MKKMEPFIAKDQRLAFILLSLILSIFFAGTGFLFRIDPVSATESQDALVLKMNTTSAKALAAIEHRFGDLNDLFHLYAVNEKDAIIELGFPGELVVAPDQTPLGDLLSGKPPQIKINAEIESLDRLFQADSLPAAKVTDPDNHLVGIIATQKAMETFRTGAVVRASENQHVQNGEPSVKADHVPGTETSHSSEAQKKAMAEHPPSETDEAPVAGGHDSDSAHTPSAQQDSSHETNPADTTAHGPSVKAVEEQSDHGETSSKVVAPTHSDPAHQKAPSDTHGKQGHDKGFDATLPRGVALIEGIIKPLDYELNDRFWGWRPNDLIRIGDNVVNFQLGVLEITRRTAIILSERVSRSGESSAFDPQLEDAMNWFMIKPNRYWFPSAESKYKDALNAFDKYKERLTKKHAKFFNRADNLIPLLMAYEDLLGSCEENLVKTTEEDGTPVSFFKADDYLYYTKGVTSALLSILTAIEHDFGDVIASRQAQGDIHHAITSCHHAIEIDPVIVVNSDPSSILANHRANLAAPISHARFYISVLIKTLST